MASIVHVANFYGPKSGGLRTAMNSIAIEYSRLGHDVTLIVPGSNDSCTKTDYGHIYEIASPILPFSGGYRFIVRRRRVQELITAFAPDVLEISDRTSLVALAKNHRKEGGIVSMWAHERVDGVLSAFLPGSAKVWEKLADKWNKRCAGLVDHVISTTDYAGAEFRRISITPHLVPLGVDLGLFAPWKRDDLWRENFSHTPLILLCSRLSREKDPLKAIEVLRNLQSRGIKGHLVVIGDGPMRRDMENASRDLPVTFLGFISDRKVVARIMASVDLVISPGPIETFGLAALESLACGTPVISSGSGAIKEIIGGAGVAVQGGVDSWSEAVLEILSRREGTRRAEARSRAEQFSWRNTVDRLTHIYEIKQEAKDVA
ncbi:MAG: glycosyltransferase [Actinobacteria bacterium]|nr:glycosyltransferase [Actinomycetota bacterium]